MLRATPVFKQQYKAANSSGEKEHWTWATSKPFLCVRSVSSLLFLTHRSQTVMRDTHFRLYWFPLPPFPRQQGGVVERFGRCRLGRMLDLAAGSPAPALRCLSAPELKAAHMCWDVPTSIKGCFCGCLRHPTWLPASLPVSLCRRELTPHSCSFKQKQPLVFPPPFGSSHLTALGVSRVACVSVSFQAPLCSPKLHGLGCCWASRSLVSRL